MNLSNRKTCQISCILLLLLLSQPARLAEGGGKTEKCVSDYAEMRAKAGLPIAGAGRAFRNWSMGNLKNLEALKPKDFLPADYIKKIEAHGDRLSVSATTTRTPGIYISIEASNVSRKQEIATFELLSGSEPGRVRIEDFSLQSPPYLSSGSKRLSQEQKGFPMDVARHFKNRFLHFLKAGNYGKLEIMAPQDFVVYTLYTKFLGARPETKEGELLAGYLREIYQFSLRAPTMRKFEINSLTKFTETFLGNYFNDSMISQDLRKAWENYKLGQRLAGTETIRGETGREIAFRSPEGMAFVVPFLLDKPILTWKELHRSCPDCFHLVKDLE
jgi:hypothetical protein